MNLNMDPSKLWRWHVPEQEGTCAVCNQTTTTWCIRCKTVFYCSPEHQKSHWPDHKKDCGIIELRQNPVIGRHYVAKRDIEPGEIVLQENGPFVIYLSHFTDYLICVNCYKDLRGEKKKICKHCGWWPVCVKCKQHGAECEFTIKYGKFKNLPDKGQSVRTEHMLQNFALGMIRILAIREANPKAYSKFLKHEDHREGIKAVHGDTVDTDIAKLVLQYFTVDMDESELAKINRILMIGGFGEDGRNHNYFAEKTAYFEHSCHPNCSKTRPDDQNNGNFRVWAVKPIAAGEHISLCYNYGDMGTMPRKNWLAKRQFFDCTCPRCEDPTEFGMMFNAVKCMANGCEGDMLPPHFHKTNGRYPDFICNTCKATVSSEIVALKQMSIGHEFLALDDDDVYGFKRFIEEYSTVLHENHFYMFRARMQLAYVLGFDAYINCGEEINMVPNYELNEKIELGEELREIHEILMPGDTRCRGRLLYGISVAYVEKVKREHNLDSRILNKLLMSLTETCQLLGYEPKSSSEGLMATEAMNLLRYARTGMIP